MLKVKVDKFCSLSTSPSWQAWLFHFDVAIYKKFIRQLQESRGCNQNKDIMIELLKELEKLPNGTDKLFEFLQKHYPHMIVKDNEPIKQKVEPLKANDIFPYYNPNILTFPRRQIIDGVNLEKLVKEFISDKIKSDFIIIDGKAYVEYLSRVDADIMAKIPQKNWQIAAWRLKSKI